VIFVKICKLGVYFVGLLNRHSAITDFLAKTLGDFFGLFDRFSYERTFFFESLSLAIVRRRAHHARSHYPA